MGGEQQRGNLVRHTSNAPRSRGRLTRRQRWALENIAPHYLANPFPHQWPDVFARTAPLGLEIGFGMGDALLHWAIHRPDMNLVGMEIYRPGIGALLLGLEREGLTNLRVLEGNAALLVADKFAPASLDEVRIWFPDPWPKRRHHKRRLIQPAFAETLAGRLRPGGVLRLATDWAEYARWMAQVFAATCGLERVAPAAVCPASAYASKARRREREIQDLAYRKKN